MVSDELRFIHEASPSMDMGNCTEMGSNSSRCKETIIRLITVDEVIDV